MRASVRSFVLFAGVAAGCYAPEPEYPYGSGPDLAYVEPGVEVVAGSDDPVFFVDGMYWLWWGDGWYSSPYSNHGWRRDDREPDRLRHLDHPERYAHFRASATRGMRRAAGFSTRPSSGYASHPSHFVAPIEQRGGISPHAGFAAHGGRR
jgi:hypothetical protein